MLSRINIQNFALIDHLDINLHQGLQVITGETGAGKSIILGALRLILGERADLKAIASSEQKSIVETEFQLDDSYRLFFEENDLDYDAHSIIRREILPSGKSRAFINDVPVTLDVLKSLTSQLIDIHSQFETSQLFQAQYQFQIVDALSDNKTKIKTYQKEFSSYQNLKKQLSDLNEQFSNANKESDYKNFLLTELEDAQLDDLDFVQLQEQLSTQENSGFISENLAVILQQFSQEEVGVSTNLLDAKQKLQKISDVAPQFSTLQKRLDEAYFELKDIFSEIENEAEKIELDPETLQILLQKINTINALFLKHQVADISALIDIRNQLSGDQNLFSDLEAQINEVENQIINLEKQLEKLSQELSSNRKKVVPQVVLKIETLLKQLGLEKAKIEINLDDALSFNNFGKDNIEMLFQANSGFPMKPIQSAISGGERSRVMLSIKKILAESSDLPTLILDEIDTGVSGRVAEEIGNVMQVMAKDMQLIVITHLAQVAAKGDYNYKVTKQDIDGKTRSTIIALDREEKLQEIAQLLSGNKVTDAAILQAKELMK
ncbi:DNA repair protein RecN [Chryseobacterium sp. T1]